MLYGFMGVIDEIDFDYIFEEISYIA